MKTPLSALVRPAAGYAFPLLRKGPVRRGGTSARRGAVLSSPLPGLLSGGRRRLPPLLFPALLLFAGFAASPSTAGENFTAADDEFVRVAEAARVASARFWSGADLPGRWSSPCPIEVRLSGLPAVGRTSFRFDRGEVSGWRMTLTGRREELLRDVLPHEVDHMVRASLIRRPLPRWLDEGCATLMESEESHRRCREALQRGVDLRLEPGFLEAADYPAAPEAVQRLYALGFSLVEFLLERGGPERLLAFQSDPRPLGETLRDFYALDSALFESEWRQWVEDRQRGEADCRTLGCWRHFPGTPPRDPAVRDPRPILTIYTSRWCGPCRRFWSDYHGDVDFQNALDQAFQLRAIDVDAQPEEWRTQRLSGIPAFVGPFGRVIGYEGKAWLLAALGLAPQAKPAPSAPAAAGAAPPVASVPESPGEPVSETHSPPDAAQVPPAATASPPHKTNDPESNPTKTPALSGQSGPAPTSRPPQGRLLDFAAEAAPVVLTFLELAGIIGGSAATGGLGGVLLAVALRWRRRRRMRLRRVTPRSREGGAAARPAPFPRALDEARQLLELRQSEGRVAVLDALRGLFLDDEFDRCEQEATPEGRQWLQRLRRAIDARVNEVAPLSVKLEA